jgi:hypothetical protein
VTSKKKVSFKIVGSVWARWNSWPMKIGSVSAGAAGPGGGSKDASGGSFGEGGYECWLVVGNYRYHVSAVEGLDTTRAKNQTAQAKKEKN